MELEIKQTVTRSASGEKGAVSIKSVLILLFLLTAIFTLIKFIPVYVEEQRVFHDTDEIARKASLGMNAYNKEKILKDIQGVIQEYSLPEDSVSLVSQEADHAEVSVKYTRPIDLLITTYNWDVDHMSTGKAGF